MLSARTINYAVPPEDHFWKWSADREAIEWQDGSTLALWIEVRTILDFLALEGGIPPLGALLLLLTACREDEGRTAALSNSLISGALVSVSRREMIGNIGKGLNAVARQPLELRSSLSAKCHLALTVFEGSSFNLSKDNSQAILEELANGMRLLGDPELKPRFSASDRLMLDLRALDPGLHQLDEAKLESRLRTGLDDPRIQVPELPEPAVKPGDPRDLLDRLIASGGEGGAAAAVAKRAIAMMNFPGRFGTPRDLPVGGIADITNRGTIDRLLPGELAWDDLVLAARLVHNEALYFRREIPPMDVAVSHTVLLDRGLRLWGTGRVFSLGVALGLRHHPALQGPGETFEVAAATADAFEYLDLTLPEGVRGALETLVPAAGPEAFLAAWWDAAKIVDDPSIPDLTFITAREHLEDDAARRLLGEIAAWIHGKDGRFRVIALTRGGELEMQAWSPGGNRLLCRGELDLDALLKPPAPAAGPSTPQPPPLRAKPDPLHEILPIYALDRLPFLFPLAPQATAYLLDDTSPATTGSGTGVSIDHRLMHWPAIDWGAEELIPNIPGRQHWIGRDEHGGVILIASGETAGEAVRVFRWEKNRLEEIEVEASRHPFPRHAAVNGGAVILAYLERVEALSLDTGRRVAELTIERLPTVPVFTYDGEKISVIDSGQEAASEGNTWSQSDTLWPRMFIPDRVSLEQGVLRVIVADKCLAFDPLKLVWSEAKAGSLRFIPFEETSHAPAPGITLKRAIWSVHMTIWLDPRGMLHLRDPFRADPPPWSILLSTRSTSCWSPAWMLCAFEPRLRQPATEESKFLPQVVLKDFLECSSSTHRPP